MRVRGTHVRGTHVIGNALRDAWLGNRWITPEDVVRDLAEHGWYLVRVERTVTDDPFAHIARQERIEVDVEGEGIHDVRFQLSREVVAYARDSQERLAWQRRNSIIKLALEIAKRKGWLDESAG